MESGRPWVWGVTRPTKGVTGGVELISIVGCWLIRTCNLVIANPNAITKHFHTAIFWEYILLYFKIVT